MKKEIELIKVLSEIFGCSFVGIRNYTTKTTGETSNYLMNVGVSYESERAKDIVSLTNAKYDDSMLEQARVKMLNSLINNANEETKSNQSKAQCDAYLHINKSVKLHVEKGELFIFSKQVSKTVLSEATKPKKKSVNPMVLAEGYIKKDLNLGTSKFRLFKFELLENVKVSGKVLTLGSGLTIGSEVQ